MRCKYLQAVGMVIVISDFFVQQVKLFFRARSKNVNKTMNFFIIQVFGGLLYAQSKYMKILRKNKKNIIKKQQKS